jgi:hypothetical protein
MRVKERHTLGTDDQAPLGGLLDVGDASALCELGYRSRRERIMIGDSPALWRSREGREMELSPEERERIYLEEVERREVNRKLDPEERARAAITERPRSVSRAVTLLAVAAGTAGVRLVILGPDIDRLRRVHSEPFKRWLDIALVACTGLVPGLMVFLIFKIAAGRNWARIALLAVVFAQSATHTDLHRGLNDAHPSVLLSVAHGVLAIVAYVCLFQPDASAWFRRRRTR